MKDFHIRKATQKDIPAIVPLCQQVQAIHRDLFPDIFVEIDDGALAEWFKHELALPENTLLVAEDEAAILGYALINREERPQTLFTGPRPRLHVDQIVVDERSRRLGTARALLEAVKRLAADLGIPLVEINVWRANHAAREAYARCGFQTRSETMWLRPE